MDEVTDGPHALQSKKSRKKTAQEVAARYDGRGKVDRLHLVFWDCYPTAVT
jgi:hypothetical protein